MALAMVGALEPSVYDRAMRRPLKPDGSAKSAQRASERIETKSDSPPNRRPGRRRKPASSALENTIGYRFKDADLLQRSLTHISAIAGGNRANSYQRLEFLGDHVLGLIISDMLFRAF